MKKFNKKMMVTALCATSILSMTPALTYAAEIETVQDSSAEQENYTEVVTVTPGEAPSTFIISDTGSLALQPGESFYKTFRMNNGSNPTHTRFRISFANVTGSWYVTVQGSNGYSHTSSTYSTDGYVEISNAQKDVRYTVTFHNGSRTYGLTADYSVVSSL